MRIIVLGYIVRGPLGGMAWHHLQYVLGLHRLGHDVYFIEDSDEYDSCFDPATGVMGSDPGYGLHFTSGLFDKTGMGDRWGYFDWHTNQWLGPAGAAALELFRSADLILNISGVNPMRDWVLLCPHRALIDTDPVFTQVRHCKSASAMEQAHAHTSFLTFGENFGRAGCSIPDDGLPWVRTRQPVVLDAWPAEPGSPEGNFTTVMQWDSYPAVEHQGRKFGMKSASFLPYMDLPRLTTEGLELALGSASAPRQQLRGQGWVVSDPQAAARDPWTYQAFIAGSKAEFSLAKHGYVASGSGWFSERSAAYLASGRPVVTENTGFTNWMQTEGGVVAFDSPESAVEAIERVSRDYSHHCRLAREVASEYFDHARVLPELLEHAMRSRAPL